MKNEYCLMKDRRINFKIVFTKVTERSDYHNYSFVTFYYTFNKWLLIPQILFLTAA
jgi:hypothetical protein